MFLTKQGRATIESAEQEARLNDVISTSFMLEALKILGEIDP